jgi:hemerythrin
MMRRVLRSIYYIINEPTQSSALLLERFKRQVEEHGPLSAEELVARTYNFTQKQYENHIKSHPTTMETEENLVQLLEEGRLQRLKNLGSTVLVAGLGIITAGEYSDS